MNQEQTRLGLLNYVHITRIPAFRWACRYVDRWYMMFLLKNHKGAVPLSIVMCLASVLCYPMSNKECFLYE